ncbi:hypothetical protein OQJ18_03305 [Fluoribacter dumoffii]|uniref:Uncharacterized protein n=1 Tax=Fluoribacter dumoffii TaxID=463 RepID=A0A377G9Z1_9GAMM|nr:hypothetical protein [Fluoribacter dumoffii]KTC88950.1 hypothetical protein Ldum_3208 [Fluoribacter dumoffii NY 23]MCW8385838.1 hypothetical protein [Fluoribacter dumoffii]MCW8418891.1 hypothetical protein [Fluoribacter dumoffii]MCW8453265.1 hypothetical protein [Fluoribacter dumoffii]MCW8482874.1 hypothetical protein [Fluoribacter dumoffii]
MIRYKLYTAEEITNLDIETFNQWLSFLYKYPTQNKSPYNGALQPSPDWLHECWCIRTQAHSRASFSNIRAKYEERILSAVQSNDKKSTIRLLSLGSGGLFQDLMILLKLYYNGYKDIELDCIENVANQEQQKILNAIIDRLNQNDANIRVRHFSTVDERNENTDSSQVECDVVYAIDFDDIGKVLGKDFSERQLEARAENSYSDALCPLFLGAYAQLRKSASSLFLLTFGKNYISHHGEKADIYCNELDYQFEKRIPSYVYHDYYYINANIFSLLLHLPFIKAKNKTLLINEEILNESTSESIKKILDQHNISYFIASADEIGKKLDAEAATVLVIDDSICNRKNPGEEYLDASFKHGHAQVTRYDLDVRKKPRNDVFFSFHEIKANQFTQRVGQLSADECVEKVNEGIINYLEWCKKNASGTRGITRFSHWFHGESGILRAKGLQKALSESPDVGKDELLSLLNKHLQGSGNTHHSLTRFIHSALSRDNELENLPDADYKEVRSKVRVG